MLNGGTDLNPVGVVGVFSEVGAAGMTRRNIFNTIRPTHWVEGSDRTGAVGITHWPVESRENSWD